MSAKRNEEYRQVVHEAENCLNGLNCSVGNLMLLESLGKNCDSPEIVQIRTKSQIEQSKCIRELSRDGRFEYVNDEVSRFIHIDTNYRLDVFCDC